MSSKATVLRESRHGEFLQAQRQDPVTHKVFAAGDRVTRCAKCLLPFLDSSWEAIGGMHCGQFASVALDNSEAPAPESEPSETEDEPTETVSDPKVGQPKGARLELKAIPNPLREVPLTLR
jgi:hypothetical protein